jgi:hypothetical protein
MSTDERNADYWRAGCECNRVGLCYRCRAAKEIEQLRLDLAQQTGNTMAVLQAQRERDALRKALNDAGEELSLSCKFCAQADRIIERALLNAPPSLHRNRPAEAGELAPVRSAVASLSKEPIQSVADVGSDSVGAADVGGGA